MDSDRRTGKRPGGSAAERDRPKQRRPAQKSPRPEKQESETPKRRKRPTPPQTTKTRKPAADKEKQPRPKHKKVAFGRMFDRSFGVKLVTSLALVFAVILCCIVFFRVNTISVTGNEKYTQEEILKASGIEKGDALLLINKSAAAGKIIAQLPYVNQIRIGVSFPNIVRLEVTELDTAYAVAATDGTYWLINSEGRVVEEVDAKNLGNYLTVKGVQVTTPAVGETIQASEEQTDTAEQSDTTQQTGDAEQTTQEATAAPQTVKDTSTGKQRLAAVLEILGYLESSKDATGITSLDVSSLSAIKLMYGSQYEVDFGGTSDLEYKVEYMIAAVSQLNDYESGVLDLTFKEEKVARFVPWNN